MDNIKNKYQVVVELRFLKSWWQSLIFATVVTLTLIFLAGLSDHVGKLLFDYFVFGIITAFTTVIGLRFYRNTKFFTKNSEIFLIASYGMVMSALLTLIPLILYNYQLIDAKLLYTLERLPLYRITLDQFNIVYGGNVVLVLMTSLLSLLLYGFSIKTKVVEAVKVTTGGITGVERSFFEAYDSWIFIMIMSLVILFLVLVILQNVFYIDLKLLKPVYDTVNGIVKSTLPGYKPF